MALTTTAIMPSSALTMPFRLIWSMARHFFPVLHPEPTMLRFVTGLVNGSRRPVRLIVFSLSFLGSAGFFLSSTAMICLGSDGLLAFATLVLGLADLALAFTAFGVTLP